MGLYPCNVQPCFVTFAHCHVPIQNIEWGWLSTALGKILFSTLVCLQAPCGVGMKTNLIAIQTVAVLLFYVIFELVEDKKL